MSEKNELNRWSVMTLEYGLHDIIAETWKCGGNGLQFFIGDECVAWFGAWQWFKKRA